MTIMRPPHLGQSQSGLGSVTNPIPTPLARLLQTPLRRRGSGSALYLGHYTHRVAISNHRLVSLVDDQVTFRWRDSAHNNEQKLVPLSLDEFLRRFLLHVLPKGFVRIRHFGFLANRRRATSCRFAFNCSEQYSHRTPNQKPLLPGARH